MNLRRHDCPVAQHQIGTRRSLIGDAVPKPLGFTAFPPEWLLLFLGRLMPPRHAGVRYRIPAAGSALRSHPCVALSSRPGEASINRVAHRTTTQLKKLLPKRWWLR
jgi:hypothetical protein